MLFPGLSPSHSERTYPSNTSGFAAFPLRDKGGVYNETFSRLADCRGASTQRDSVLLARLRAGHTPNQLGTTVDPKFSSCGEEPQTVEHWLRWCPNAVALGQHLFGEPSTPLFVLTTNSGSVQAHARKTLHLGP